MFKAKFTFEFVHSTGRGFVNVDIILEAKDKFSAEKQALLTACSQLTDLKSKQLLYYKIEDYVQQQKY